jgi:tRNA pseudouridine32 synthase / 23S rRNA pseudouridine746 synthase
LSDPAPLPDLRTVYVDEVLIVLDKPAGLLSVPGRGADKQDCLSTRAQAHFPDALVVHRLDMATSGLMIMARGAAAQRALSDAFASRTVTKRYVAVVGGELTTADGEWGVIDLPIVVDWPNRPLRIIDAVRGKPSVTRWRVQPSDAPHQPGNPIPDTTRLELEPLTGRSHQLRIHLKAIGHAIVGDALYADTITRAKADRLLLHACTLTLVHPVTGTTMAFQSCPPF